MSTILLIGIALGAGIVIGAAVAALFWYKQSCYIVDILIAIAVLSLLQLLPAALFFGVQFALRRIPATARGLASLGNLHPVFASILTPGAIERLDTAAAAQPPAPAIAPATLRQAERAFEDGRRARRITRLQYKNSQFARQTTGEPRIPQTNPVPATAQTIRIYASEAEQIADALGRGEAPSDIAKSLKGYRPEEYKRFKAKVDAVAAALGANSQ